MDILSKYSDAFLGGAATTFQMALISWTLGIVFGLLIGFWGYKSKLVNQTVGILGFFLGAIPVIVLLFWVHYPLQSLLGVTIDPFVSATILFVVINTMLVAIAIQRGSKSIPSAYSEVALMSNLSAMRIFLKIELPLLLRAALPGIINTQVVILHMTLFASLISVDELFRVAQRVNSLEYKPVEIYTIIAIFYLILSVPLMALSQIIERRFHNVLGENK